MMLDGFHHFTVSNQTERCYRIIGKQTLEEIAQICSSPDTDAAVHIASCRPGD